MVTIEHHLDVIADADYVIEIGPDGGEASRLLYAGTSQASKRTKKASPPGFCKKREALEGNAPPFPRFVQKRKTSTPPTRQKRPRPPRPPPATTAHSDAAGPGGLPSSDSNRLPWRETLRRFPASFRSGKRPPRRRVRYVRAPKTTASDDRSLRRGSPGRSALQ